MSLDGFTELQRGALVLRWTPGGDLDKFVVLRVCESATYLIAQVHEDGSITVDGSDAPLTETDVEEEEAFGYTYIFTSGETFKLPEWIP